MCLPPLNWRRKQPCYVTLCFLVIWSFRRWAGSTNPVILGVTHHRQTSVSFFKKTQFICNHSANGGKVLVVEDPPCNNIRINLNTFFSFYGDIHASEYLRGACRQIVVARAWPVRLLPALKQGNYSCTRCGTRTVARHCKSITSAWQILQLTLVIRLF
jgi:hypothetical protein